MKEKDFLKYVSADGYGNTISEDDIILRKHSVNFAMGDKNPFESVKFYIPPNTKGKCYADRNFSLIECFHKDQRTVSNITPSVF